VTSRALLSQKCGSLAALLGKIVLFLNLSVALRVIPVTAHAAFDKGGDYLGIKVHHIPVDPVTRQVDLKRVARAMYVPPCFCRLKLGTDFCTLRPAMATRSWCARLLLADNGNDY
jgi:hypothetical protein